MMGFNPKRGGVSSPVKGGGGGGWEVRPGGMFVQRRNSDFDKNSNIKVKVKFGSSYDHEIVPLSPHANFGELKKSRSGPTGLQENGVKDGSKITLMENECPQRRRHFEDDVRKASGEISAVGFEIDNLAKQVASIEMEINGGYKVVDTNLSNLIELLMTQLIKLDGIEADGDLKMQRRVQVKRVQKYIEVLDLLKIKNSGQEKMPLQKERFNGRRMNQGAPRCEAL